MEWELQRSLALQDIAIGGEQLTIANDHARVVGQEGVIAQLQADNAAATADFLANKFTSAELYDWMSDVLGRVYGFFLAASQQRWPSSRRISSPSSVTKHHRQFIQAGLLDRPGRRRSEQC